MLLEAGFDAVRTVVLAVRAALVGDTDGDSVYRLAYYAGGLRLERLGCLLARKGRGGQHWCSAVQGLLFGWVNGEGGKTQAA